MKVLFVSPTGVLGGAERVLLSALGAIRMARPEVQCHLLVLSAGPLVERATELGVETTVLPAPAGLQLLGDSRLKQSNRRAFRAATMALRSIPLIWSTWRYVRQLRRRIRELGPDLIHSNGIKTHALLWLTGIRSIPIVWHVHDFLGQRPLARRILSWAVGRAAGAIAISNAVAEDLRRLWPRLDVQVIANAVDTDRFHPGSGDPALLDRLAELPPRPCLRVGLVATYARWKGQDVFIAAAARVMRDCPDVPVRFYVIGGPIYQTHGSQWSRPELNALARQLRIDDQVGFIEFQLNVQPIYRALDIVVHASTAPEPFGLTIVEAMACGKPVIVAAAGGAAEIIRPGHDALATPPGDEGALASALSALLNDPTMRKTLGLNARRTVCERYDERRFSAEFAGFVDRFQPQLATANRARAPKCLTDGERILHAEHP
jgi:glycosyltransferase involved in cell wall biosynthesis